MLNIIEWIPDGIRKNKVAAWLIGTAELMAVAAVDTYAALSARYDGALKENQDMKYALSAADSGECRRAAELKESRLGALNAALLSNSNRITETHKELYETSATAAYYQKECEKNDGGAFSNTCEMASKYGSQAASLREQIGSLEKNAEILNEQILALDSKG
ncbi:hypothetical protein [Pantoea dispersa]|uniref:hypothetical protein n=1 Tax=Pantoea dispersa TaxID=59814 RepID=UPI0007369452|nr:hypothetical protein [Pantoea dispersa]KTR98490.1 hypothetical protein NS375_16345 [Pantoea dispersa]